MPLIEAIGEQRFSDVERLLDKGASPDSIIGPSESEGKTALEIAAGTGNVQLVRLLLDRGADINAPDAWGGTAIISAACAESPEVVRLLISRGADVNADDDGATAVGYAENFRLDAENSDERQRFSDVITELRAVGGRRYRYWFW